MKEDDPTIFVKLELRACVITMRYDSILEMEMKAVDEFLLEDAVKCAEAIKQLAKDKKIALLSTISYYVSMDKDVREFWASEVLENFITCEAFVIENVSMKMIIKFYIQFNKPKRRSQLFSSYSDAIEWLKECS